MIKRLRQKGAGAGAFRRTPQRLAILDYLEGNLMHPSADEIFGAVARRHRSMSLATVYNTLNTLVEAGVVRELTIDPDRRRYDPDLSVHHHLICLDCKRIVDIKGKVAVDLPKGAARGFTVTGNHIEFYGTCPACRSRKRVH